VHVFCVLFCCVACSISNFVFTHHHFQVAGVYRILGVRDMGSNFYPFTAARKGNKLVTKGLFSKSLSISSFAYCIQDCCCSTELIDCSEQHSYKLDLTAGYVRHPMYCGLCFLSFGLCAITGSQARLALSVAFWILLNHKVRVFVAYSLLTLCYLNRYCGECDHVAQDTIVSLQCNWRPTSTYSLQPLFYCDTCINCRLSRCLQSCMKQIGISDLHISALLM